MRWSSGAFAMSGCPSSRASSLSISRKPGRMKPPSLRTPSSSSSRSLTETKMMRWNWPGGQS